MISIRRHRLIYRNYLKQILKKDINLDTIGLVDPSLGSRNIGDEIISESVNQQLVGVFPRVFFIKGFTQQKNGISTTINLMKTNKIFVGGSNLLSKRVLYWNQWNISKLDLIHLKEKFILMGVGNWKYQNKIGIFSRFFYKRLLHKKYLHSVRDEYTLEALKQMGISNVINTGCPTMWNLTEEHCKKIPKAKSEKVIFTITDYGQYSQSSLFGELITILLNKYKEVFFFPQGANDLSVFKEIDIQNKNRINIISPNLKAFADFLASNETDYIGTRLHGGIKALNCFKRTIIIAIDNRAIEKQKDFNIPIVKYNELDTLEDLIDSEWSTEIKINSNNIDIWKSQFLR